MQDARRAPCGAGSMAISTPLYGILAIVNLPERLAGRNLNTLEARKLEYDRPLIPNQKNEGKSE